MTPWSVFVANSASAAAPEDGRRLTQKQPEMEEASDVPEQAYQEDNRTYEAMPPHNSKSLDSPVQDRDPGEVATQSSELVMSLSPCRGVSITEEGVDGVASRA